MYLIQKAAVQIVAYFQFVQQFSFTSKQRIAARSSAHYILSQPVSATSVIYVKRAHYPVTNQMNPPLFLKLIRSKEPNPKSAFEAAYA